MEQETKLKAQINRLQEVVHYTNQFLEAQVRLNDYSGDPEDWLDAVRTHMAGLHENDLMPYYDEDGEYIS